MDTRDERTALISSSWRLGRRGSKRNPYEQIDKRGFVGRKDSRKPKMKVQRLGSKMKRSWGFKMPKIRIRVVSPLCLLARLRDSYVNMMNNFATRRCVGIGMGPMDGRARHPGRIKSASTQRMFSEAELMYIEYMRRDPAFMRSILGS